MKLAEAKVAKTRAAHEKAVDELKKTYDIRKEQQQEQLLRQGCPANGLLRKF